MASARPPLKIAYFGLPLGALVLQGDGHALVYVATRSADDLGMRRLRRRVGSAPLVVRPDFEQASEVARVRDARPDLIVSWYYSVRIAAEVLEMAPAGAIGVHPSLLPALRGPDPFYWAIRRGLDETGVSLHRLEADYDTGPVLATRRVAIGPHDDAWRLARALDRPSLALLRWGCARASAGELARGEIQDESRATYAPRPSDDDLQIDWREDAADVVRRVRAAAPWPGAGTLIGDASVVVTRAEIANDPVLALEVGEAAVLSDPDGVERVVVRAGDAGVALLEGRPLGGDDAPLSVSALVRLARTLARPD